MLFRKGRKALSSRSAHGPRIMTPSMRPIARLIGTFALLALPVMASAASFTDITADSPVYAAAEYLKANGILQGYDDGTFRPDQPVNRAEVIKVIVLNRVSLNDLQTASGTSANFRDVTTDQWFAPYVAQAYSKLRIIDGPPTTYTFAPDRPVTRAEFLKMLLLAYEADPVSSYGELTYPLSQDTTDNATWFYPYIRYALTASVITPQDEKLEPGEQLTRGDIAQMLYRFLLYREGKRTQTLLSVTENETTNALRFLETDATDNAAHAAARAILASRGALFSQPNDNTVKSAVKTAEAIMTLVKATNALQSGDKAKALDASSTAWHLGEKAKSFSSAFDAIIKQIQSAAAKVADAARTTN